MAYIDSISSLALSFVEEQPVTNLCCNNLTKAFQEHVFNIIVSISIKEEY